MSPTARSLKYLRDAGCLAEVVERWIPGANVRKDLFGWCDIVCLDPREDTVAVAFIQTTTKSNMKSRIAKITNSDTVDTVRKAGVEIYVHGWFKRQNRWQVSVEDLS